MPAPSAALTIIRIPPSKKFAIRYTARPTKLDKIKNLYNYLGSGTVIGRCQGRREVGRVVELAVERTPYGVVRARILFHQDVSPPSALDRASWVLAFVSLFQVGI